jgi:hypothetical protein
MGLNGFVFGKIPGRIFKFPLILRCLHKLKMGSFGNFIFCVEPVGEELFWGARSINSPDCALLVRGTDFFLPFSISPTVCSLLASVITCVSNAGAHHDFQMPSPSPGMFLQQLRCDLIPIFPKSALAFGKFSATVFGSRPRKCPAAGN